MASPANIASGTIVTSRFVTISGSNTVAQCGANGRIYGVSQEGGRVAPTPDVTADPPQAAVSGEQLTVHHVPGTIVMVEVGTGGVTAGGLVESDSNGKAVTAGTTAATVREVGGIALATVAAGGKCPIELRQHSRTNPA